MNRHRKVHGDWLAQTVTLKRRRIRLVLMRMAWLRGIYDDGPRSRSQWRYRTTLRLGKTMFTVEADES